MNCPKCNTAFEFGTKFCQKCGCNLQTEIIENPVCPKCNRTFSTGTKFCENDGSKLVSPEKMIPRCEKCDKEYSAKTKFCPDDGGRVIPEALRSGLNNIPKGIKEIISSMTKNVDVEKLTNTKIIGIISLVLASLSAIIVLYIILSFFSSGDLRFAGMLTGQFNLFVLYLHYGCLGWIITAIVLSGLAKFIPVFMKEEDNISEAGENIAGFAGGLAVLFLLAGIFARFIVGV